MKYLVSCIQMCSTSNIEKNIEVAVDLIHLAISRNSKLICLPENFAYWGADKYKIELIEDIHQAWSEKIIPLAKEYGVYIVAGGHPTKASASKFYNTSSLIDPSGNILAQYHKIHLYDIDIPGRVQWQESQYTMPGEKAIVQKTELGNIGFSICYDIRFPELYRKMSELKAEILTIGAAFSMVSGREHWNTLLRARAIENQCYVLAAAQWGKPSSSWESYGDSSIIDPWGKVLACAANKTGIISAEVDLEYLQKVRQSLPALQHKVKI
ncbi:MAG TPA: carbon-nitrogen hydrolase family protein [Planctomycetota bacterium]|nr:carbon-nitrogen hydrolase family protein [Planctomycetota bacterium]